MEDRSALERAARALMRYPFVCYAVRGAQMRLRPPRADTPPLRGDVERFAPLFERAVERFEELVRPWTGEFAWPAGRTNNGTFESVDVELYHSVIRTYRPGLVVEMGGGHSTRFAAEALRRNGGGRVVVVDPRPRVRLPRGIEHHAVRTEDADLALFERLEANDVLFIDSSHTTEEARYHVREILPRLRSGVVIHHHDVLFPYDVCYGGDREVFGEQDVLLDLYLAEPDRYEVVTGAAWVAYARRSSIEELVASYRWQPGRIPGSLWTRKR